MVVLAGLWVVSGFGGRLRTEPYQSRHYAVMRWFLDLMYRGAERTYGLRVEVDEPEFTAAEAAARLTRPAIVLQPARRARGLPPARAPAAERLPAAAREVVMKATLQLDPSVDIVGNRLPNVFIKGRQTGENIFTREIRRLARGLDSNGALVIFPEGGNWTPHRWRPGDPRAGAKGPSGPGRQGPGHAQPAPAAARRDPGRHLGLPRRRRNLCRPRRPGQHHHPRRRVGEVPHQPGHPGQVVAGAGRRGAA